MPLARPDPIELLTLQRRWTAELDSPATEAERFRGVRVVQAADSGRWRLLAGSTLPGEVLARITERLTASATPFPKDALVEAVRPAVAGGGVPRLDGLQVHVFGSAPPAPAPPPGTAIVTADDGVHPSHLRAPVSWDGSEWEQLVAGDLGPWAAVVDGEQVVALCHTPKSLGTVAAECGVWTDPRRRRQGLAAAVTARWANLLAGKARHLFYCHDSRNEASARVARRLGLHHVGTEWTISAEPWSEGDAWGEALVDHLRGRWTPTPLLEVDDGTAGDAMHPEWFFRDFDRWDWWEQTLLPRAVRSPALDLGAGAGRSSLWLQRRGVEVTAVDSSAGAVEVCRARGVIDARLGDLNDPPSDRRWRLILLLCGNLGLGGSYDGTRRLLERLSGISAGDALLVGDTVDPRGRAEVGLRIRHRDSATPWWRQYNIPVTELPAIVDGTGWTVERHLLDLPDHAVLLRRS